MSEAIIVALIGAGAGAFGALLGAFVQRRQNKASAKKDETQAADQITEIAMKLIAPLKTRIDELEAEVAELKARNVQLISWAEKLCEQVKALGGEPLPPPILDQLKKKKGKA